MALFYCQNMTQQQTITEAIAANQLTKTKYQRQIDAIRLIPQAVRAAPALGRVVGRF